MKLSVILCCLDESAVIRTQLDALAGQEWSEPWEFVVADNGSTAGTQDIVMSYRDRIPNLRLVDASDKRGLAHARHVRACEAARKSVGYGKSMSGRVHLGCRRFINKKTILA